MYCQEGAVVVVVVVVVVVLVASNHRCCENSLLTIAKDYSQIGDKLKIQLGILVSTFHFVDATHQVCGSLELFMLVVARSSPYLRNCVWRSGAQAATSTRSRGEIAQRCDC